MYLSKELLLLSYKGLSHMSKDPALQGQTQKTSFLRYCYALDEMKKRSGSSCDTKNGEDKAGFIFAVGNVVSINASFYTVNFHQHLEQHPDYAVGSNFFSVNVVSRSLIDPSIKFAFPKRKNNPVFEVQNGVLLVDSIQYKNLREYLSTPSLRLCFAFWLARNLQLDSGIAERDIFQAVQEALLTRYTSEAVEILLGNKKEHDVSLLGNIPKRLFGTQAAQLTDSDILSLFEVSDYPVVENETYSDEDFLREVFMSREDLADIKSLIYRKKNIILQGAPGTGKTYAAKRLAWLILGKKTDNRCEFVQFHQSSTYEMFIEGFRPNNEGGFEAEVGRFVAFCKEAENDSEGKPYCFVIDEINRANISKVFGETLMLIEADHRGDAVVLPLTGERFVVPNNLYIIGMMNTADRSLALIDYALRRRFAFFEMKPALRHPAFVESVEESGVPSLTQLVYAVVNLNKTIETDDSLGSGYQIGHSYFCVGDESTETTPIQIVKYELRPLLEEYWFDDSSKVDTETRKLLDAATETKLDE